MSQEVTAKTIQDNRTRAQKAKALHEQKNKERASDISDTKALYQTEASAPVLADVLTKAHAFMAYHQKLAQDGVGARKTGYRLENGTDEVENYNLNKDDRVRELDKAAGQQELVDFIERQMKQTDPVAK